MEKEVSHGLDLGCGICFPAKVKDHSVTVKTKTAWKWKHLFSMVVRLMKKTMKAESGWMAAYFVLLNLLRFDLMSHMTNHPHCSSPPIGPWPFYWNFFWCTAELAHHHVVVDEDIALL